jgi:hypothetical protein
MTTDLVARVAYTIARTRHARRRRPAGAPVVVFSQAKTGSSAVAAGLRAATTGPVHHVHDLDREHLAREEIEYRWGGRPWRIWDAQQALRRPPTEDAPWRVVSLVRDPIAQSVSAFFQPAVRRGYVHGGATIDSLRERFGDRLDHVSLRWFPTHVEPAFGIDVFATAFDHQQRYQILSTPTVRLLLLRCEDLAVAPAALAELLGVAGPIDVPRSNVGAEKDYAALYESFLATVRPSQAQLDRAYGSRVVRHFYTEAEIDGLRGRWSPDEPRSPSAAPVDGPAAR